MTTESTFQESELDKLGKQFAASKLDSLTPDQDTEQPMSSKSTPEGKKPETVTEDGRRVLFVAASSSSKAIASIIARIVREDNSLPPVLSAVGAASVNQAVKAIAIARNYVKGDDVELVVSVSRKPQQDVRDVISLVVDKVSKDTYSVQDEKENKEEVTEMKVSAKSVPKSLAGAIAGNLSEKGLLKLTGIGQGAVFRGTCAVTIARKYVKKQGKDLVMLPQFVELDFDTGSKVNGLQLVVAAKC